MLKVSAEMMRNTYQLCNGPGFCGSSADTKADKNYLMVKIRTNRYFCWLLV